LQGNNNNVVKNPSSATVARSLATAPTPLSCLNTVYLSWLLFLPGDSGHAAGSWTISSTRTLVRC
jgi:hypothetical protein